MKRLIEYETDILPLRFLLDELYGFLERAKP